MFAANEESAAHLTVRPPRPHGTHVEFVVFEMMVDIDVVTARLLHQRDGCVTWSILKRLHDAHIVQRELHFADLWLDIDQPRELILRELERLVAHGLAHHERNDGNGLGGRLELTDDGMRRIDQLARSIGEIVTRTCRKAGHDPFAGHSLETVSSRPTG